MRSQYNTKASSDGEIEIYFDSPHQFFVDRQQQFLTSWNISATYLVIFLQRSSISFEQSDIEVIREKDKLRARFIRLGCGLIFDLLDRGYQSDLFDPRTGYPLLSQPGELTLDDNAVVKALLNYQAIAYQNCSLLNHPLWGHNIYPATIATSAPQDVLELAIAAMAIG